MRLIYLLCLLFIATYTSSQDLVSGGVLKPAQANMDIRHYRIVLDVDPQNQSIDGYAEIDMNILNPTNTILLDLVNLFRVTEIYINDEQARFDHNNDLIEITSAQEISAGAHTVKVVYGGKPGVAARPPWDGGFTWETDGQGNPWIAITCQGEGAKIYFPCKDHPSDEPNEGAELVITVPEGLVVAGPGLLKDVKTRRGKTTFHWETNYTINNYSILFNVGKFEIVERIYSTVEGNQVPMQFFILEEHVDRAGTHLDILERHLQVEEKYFGEYPWIEEKIAICETPHLGMEHQTMNAYGNQFKYDTIGGLPHDWLMLHELGHEWWGNKVTGIDWSDMWIQEGICVFGDAMFTEEYGGREAYLQRMKRTARATRNQFPLKIGENIGSDEAYHPDIYGKGAFFMHTLRYILGDDSFFPILKKLATDPAYTIDNLVSTDDVEKLFSKESGMDMKPVFDFYLRTTNKLEVKVLPVNNSIYQIELLNYEGILPIDIRTDQGTERLMVSRDGVQVKSSTPPIVDPDVFYLKRVIQEW